jgi:hypothetical protein
MIDQDELHDGRPLSKCPSFPTALQKALFKKLSSRSLVQEALFKKPCSRSLVQEALFKKPWLDFRDASPHRLI